MKKQINNVLFSKISKNRLNGGNSGGMVKRYIEAGQSSATKRAYASDLRHFLACGGSVPCKPKKLAQYLADSANNGLATATLERRVTAIHKAHIEQKYLSPATSEIVKKVMQGIRRTLGTKQRQVHPVIKDELLAALDYIDNDETPLKTARNRALLLVGFSSAMRRSELVGIRVEHLNYSSKGLEIEIPVSKTDQQRSGRVIFIPRASKAKCPVRALKYWLMLSGIKDGYIFRAVNRHEVVSSYGLSAQSVALILKATMAKVGLNVNQISGHSLRAGFCTTAADLGWPTWMIREQTGHKSDITLAKYIRHTNKKMAPSLL